MSIDFEKVEFDLSNPEPRCPCVLLVDTSGSMTGEPMRQLNSGLGILKSDLCRDEMAMLRVEVAIVKFGGRVELAQDFITAGDFEPPTLTAGGDTPMGAGISLALDLIDSRKQIYKTNGVPYYRPWIFLITDGAPTDGDLWRGAAQRIQTAESSKRVAFFAVGVHGADMSVLAQINPTRHPVALQGLAFREMFLWLSASMKSVSHSEVGSQVPLQAPIGWAAI